MRTDNHPLLDVLLAAAAGTFPPADGQVIHLPPLPTGHQAVVSLTGRAYLATVEPIAGLDGFGAALQPDVLHRIAGQGGIGTLDVTLTATGQGGGDLPLRHDLDGHPRVRHARKLREDVRVHGDHRGLVTIACGLAGRTELSVEATVPAPARGSSPRHCASFPPASPCSPRSHPATPGPCEPSSRAASYPWAAR